jgi:alkylation response protein AidB-like acyl-CoA dehydrogenase
MDLSYSEEQLLLRDSAERFLRQEYDFARRQSIAASPAGWSAAIWAQFAELGLLALPLPEAYGGLGGGAVDLGLLMEAFGQALVIEPYLATVVLGAGAIASLGDAAQQAAILPGVAEGAIRLAFAHGERGGRNDIGAVAAVAHRAGTGWRLEGRKTNVLGAGAADTLVVSARVPGGIGLFLVPAAATGVAIAPYPILDGSRAGDVTLSGVAVGAGALLGGSDDALPSIEAVIDRAIIALASDGLGAMSFVLDATVEYSRTRVQFGQPIGRFQALQHRMAEMAVLREEARAIALFAVMNAGAPPAQRARAASAAKVKIGRAARQIAEQAVQLHGAMGVTEELNIGAYLKRALTFDLLFGSADHHLRRYAALAQTEGFIGDSLAA